MLIRSACLLLLSSNALIGCNKAEPWPEEPTSRPVKLLTVIVGQKSFIRTFPATTEAGDKAAMAFRTSGKIDNISVLSGQNVEQGQVIATLKSDEAELVLAQTRAQFQLAEVQLDRAKTLIKDKVISEQKYDDAVASHKSAYTKYEQARTNVGYTELIAPYNGSISLVFAEENQWINANQPVLNIQSNDLLKVVFQLPDYLLSRFQNNPAQAASVRFDSLPNQSYPVTFLEIDTQSDVKTGSYKVTMVMQKPERARIYPGMSGQLEVEIPQGRPNAIPETALFECDAGQCVWRVDETGHISEAMVQLSETGNVESGLDDGDQIVVFGVHELTSDMHVREWVKEQGL